ncbi:MULTISPECIES: 2-hydroxyacid dehydrogenase [unclassified Spirosoma]|uniref:2-hydroxyacid dehydrogenase n=1 Tax=unclassified Spirosoma TaxID=2621999 RepID=UPI0009636820|nr:MULTISPECIES: 2-hydroxyacid dehydrogenase [unclassified Spirosoma]MBN8824185.1 2-hydroxyacid dehydrogenase [Spirosoma sp.]OJW78922.1 MAG: hydroxyacid dehydrogenase [Spirosoma sp. 48-14]
MKIAFFSYQPFEQPFLESANQATQYQLTFIPQTLSPETAILAAGHDAICVFVHDQLNAPTLQRLADLGIKLVALRCTGYNQVDIETAQQLGIRVLRVPTYSPHSVAEHTVALLMALNRKIHLAYQRTRKNNFTLDGLLGFDLYGKRIGIVGTGKIGVAFARIMLGFGCHVIAYDKIRSAVLQQLGVEYRTLPELLSASDIVSLHCPLTPETHHLINSDSLKLMKTGAYLLNTSRGGLIDTPAVLHALQSGQLGAFGLDVYELEEDYFFADWSEKPLPDSALNTLTHLPNVVVTSHQGFLTEEALSQIAQVTLSNLTHPEQAYPANSCVVVG